jgi:superoxide reductase
MTEINQIYKCDICGNIIELVHKGADALVCCGQPMNLQEEKTKDEGKEKHVPVGLKADDGVKIKVGSVEHPMEETHYIEWIEVIKKGNVVCKKFLKPGDKPEMDCCFEEGSIVRAYCNVHGLWKS